MIENRHTHLLCSAGSPLIAGGKLRGELLLYNVPAASLSRVFKAFADLTGKILTPDSDAGELSGGQKVLLMALLALFSPAPRIKFQDLWTALDEGNRTRLRALLSELGSAKEISYTEALLAD